MVAESSNPLAEGLIYEAELPLAWRPLAEALADSELVRRNDANELLLKAIGVLEEYRGEAEEAASGTQQELARLEFKVDLILDLISRMLVRQLQLPAAVACRLGAQGLAWLCRGELPPVGSMLQLELYLQPRYPSPLLLVGEVVGTEAGGEASLVTVAFRDLSPVLEDALEKLIFRHHRRSVALARGRPNEG